MFKYWNTFGLHAEIPSIIYILKLDKKQLIHDRISSTTSKYILQNYSKERITNCKLYFITYFSKMLDNRFSEESMMIMRNIYKTIDVNFFIRLLLDSIEQVNKRDTIVESFRSSELAGLLLGGIGGKEAVEYLLTEFLPMNISRRIHSHMIAHLIAHFTIISIIYSLIHESNNSTQVKYFFKFISELLKHHKQNPQSAIFFGEKILEISSRITSLSKFYNKKL